MGVLLLQVQEGWERSSSLQGQTEEGGEGEEAPEGPRREAAVFSRSESGEQDFFFAWSGEFKIS